MDALLVALSIYTIPSESLDNDMQRDARAPALRSAHTKVVTSVASM